MRLARSFVLVVVLITILGLSVGVHARATRNAPDGRATGQVAFEVSCTPAVAALFDQAVAYLHHMQYLEAQTTFKEIAAIDPTCAAAQWGIAMTRFQPLWPVRPTLEALEQGWTETQQARRLNPAPGREATLVNATAEFFRDPKGTDWWTRIRRWNAAMGAAFAARPDDSEVGAFYALSLLAVASGGDDRLESHALAAGVLQTIHRREPRHPGAVHYTIHANDIAGREGQSLEIVRSYDDIAPHVPHALHMPTHIFVRLGQWTEVIRWNQRSAVAALDFPAGDRVSHHYAHALDYLAYAHLQRGDDVSAEAVVRSALTLVSPIQESFMSAFHLAAMPARLAVERRAWDEARAIVPRTPDTFEWDQFWWAESLSWFARGLGAARSGDLPEATRALQRLEALREAAKAGGEPGFATSIEVSRLVLESWHAHGNGQKAVALRLATEAAALDATTEKHPVTPGDLYPPQESLGDLLHAQGRFDEAVEAFAAALVRWPGRLNSHLGAARAALAAGAPETARQHYRAIVAGSDGVKRPRREVEEARRTVG